MTSYEVQYELPVDNPVSSVGKCVMKGRIVFLVPINHPDAHNMGFQDLIAAAELSGRLVLSTILNNKRLPKSTDSSKTGECRASSSTQPGALRERPSLK